MKIIIPMKLLFKLFNKMYWFNEPIGFNKTNLLNKNHSRH